MLDLEKIELLRKERGLSQQEMALRAGLTGKQVWNDIVQGRRENITMKTLDAIAKALGVNPREIIR